jgi:GAF domain-containing protein
MTNQLINANPAESQQKALLGVITRIREPLDLDVIFKTTATEVRHLLRADRVAIFRFVPNSGWNEGEFVAEDVDEQWPSALAAKIHDHCFGNQFAADYHHGRMQIVPDIYAAGLSECHIAILSQFQVRANLVVPLLKRKDLWGLLCLHQCSEPRSWSESDIEFAQQIAGHLAVALQQAELLAQAQIQTEQQQALAGVIARIRESLDLDTIFKTTATEVRHLLQADRVAVFRFAPDSGWDDGEFVSESVGLEWASALAAKVRDHCFGEQFAADYHKGRIQIVADIHTAGLSDCHIAILRQFQVRANLVVPLLKGKELWGLLCIHQCGGPRYWTEAEIEFVKQIAEHLGVALQHADVLEKAQEQATQLAKASEQQRATERLRALSTTIDKIRQSLDIQTIFQTTTHEVRQLLNVERVGIYRFFPDWSGEFVAESVAEGWTPLVGLATKIEDTHLQVTRGGRYAQNQTLAVDDIYTAGLSPSHIALLEEFEARAYAVVPIFLGDNLWGLLGAYQNSSSHHWGPDDVHLLAQVGSQLGVALQQAETLKQVKLQSEQLEKAAERQRALATTIEKIRQSLDLETIFKTTTQEVRQFLEVERVAIYRFYEDWSGEFVADSIVDGWVPMINSQPLAVGSFMSQNRAGQYPRNEAFVPILQGQKLWGLLVAYQNSQPRYWQDEEINLLAQVGVQLGIALQQAEFLEQTRRQATELTQTLQELQQSQSQLIQGEKMAALGQLVAGVAHEINNPLNFIAVNVGHIKEYTEGLLTLINLYQNHYPEPIAEIQQYSDGIDLAFICTDLPSMCASMETGTQRIQQIVSSLRNFSRLDEATVKRVDLHEGIESTLLILQHRLKGNGDRPEIQIIRHYGDLPLVECYPAQLNQVFMNILGNAIDALEGGLREEALKKAGILKPTIQIYTRVENGQVVIRLINNGPEIPKEVQSRIFDPFFTTKAVGKGTGLGLAISHQIVTEEHRGEIRCISSPELGTEFWIAIPILSPGSSEHESMYPACEV